MRGGQYLSSDFSTDRYNLFETNYMSHEDRQMQIPVSLGKPSLRRRLEAYYSVVAPDTIAASEWLTRFDQIYAKYGGTEQGEAALEAKLAKKYGPTVRLLTATAKTGSASSQPAPSSAVSLSQIRQTTEEDFELSEEVKSGSDVDFLSPNFNPLHALQVSDHTVWASNPWLSDHTAMIMDRVEQCRSLLPESDPLHRAALASGRKRDRSSRETQAAQRPKTPSILATLASEHSDGPLSTLFQAFTNRTRVRVVIRYVNGIRGTLTGFLLAYDKHFNLLLRDVEEVYSPRPSSTDTSNLEHEMQRRRNNLTWSVRKRRMKQMMVRGDNVVLVYVADQEESAWPVFAKGTATQTKYRRRSVRVVPSQERVGSVGSLIHALAQGDKPRPTAKRGRRYDHSS